jgi:hypothetical protein
LMAQVTKTPVAGPSGSNERRPDGRDGEHLVLLVSRLARQRQRRNALDDHDHQTSRIRSRKTGEERTVPSARVAFPVGAASSGPKWLPDNRSVLIESRDAQGAGFGFYRLAIDTGNTRLWAHVPRGRLRPTRLLRTAEPFLLHTPARRSNGADAVRHRDATRV